VPLENVQDDKSQGAPGGVDFEQVRFNTFKLMIFIQMLLQGEEKKAKNIKTKNK
jgi:hypothetical protein